MDAIGNKIYDLRVQNEDSQDNLANKLSVSRQLISRWERGLSSPDLETLSQIGEIYNVQLNHFIEMPQDNKKNPSFDFLDTRLLNIMIVTLTLLVAFFMGPLSLFLSVPALLYSIKKRNVFWIIFFGLVVVFGLYVFMTVFFPQLVPHKITIIESDL